MLPHGPSMQLIGHVLEFDGDRICCQVKHPFPSAITEPMVPSWWGIEMAAQAAGSLLAMKGNSSDGEGRLVQIRSLSLPEAYLPRDEPLLVTAQLKSAASIGLNLFSCTLCTTQRKQLLLQAMLCLLIFKADP